MLSSGHCFYNLLPMLCCFVVLKYITAVALLYKWANALYSCSLTLVLLTVKGHLN